MKDIKFASDSDVEKLDIDVLKELTMHIKNITDFRTDDTIKDIKQKLGQ